MKRGSGNSWAHGWGLQKWTDGVVMLKLSYLTLYRAKSHKLNAVKGFAGLAF